MIFAIQPDRALIDELVALLDEEISLLNRKRSALDALSDALVERDDDRMQSLLDEMEQTQRGQASTDVKLDALRNILATKAGCRREEVVLCELIEGLGDDDRVALDYRRQQIVILAEQLRRKHMETVLLLAESIRVNRLFIEQLCPKSEPVDTYGTTGVKSWRAETGLLNAEL